jgi:hypothetical protein
MAYFHSPQIVKDGLVLLLDAANTKSYPGSGTTWFDRSVAGNSLSLLNGIGYSAENGGCLTFDGTNDLATASDNTQTEPLNVSFFAVVKQSTTAQSVTFIGGNGNTGLDGYWLGAVGSNYVFSVGNNNQHNGGVAQFSIIPEDTAIHYLGGTFDGTTIRTYSDGVLTNTITHSAPGPLAYDSISEGFKLGNVDGNNANRYWTGNIYYVQLYNRSLSAAEVLQNYNATKGRFGL